MKEKPRFNQLSGEKYSTAKAIGLFPYLYGKRGLLAVGAYEYFRWVDDLSDGLDLTKDEKTRFIQRQISIVSGKRHSRLNKEEENFLRLPWHEMKENKAELKLRSLQILYSIQSDIYNQGFTPRTHREIKHNIWMSVGPCTEALGLIINKKPIRPTTSFMQLIYHWTSIGNLRDFREDINAGMLQVGFKKNEKEELLRIDSLEKRRSHALKIYDNQRFEHEKQRHLNGIRKNTLSFNKLDLPLAQRLIATLYMSKRVPTKTQKVTRPNL